jgi:hypothetical protein
MVIKEKLSSPPCSDASILAATGRDWKAWCAVLEEKGARALSHTELARVVNELHSAGGWWSQTIAVGFERLSGKRELYGQADGTFTASVSKTLSAEPGLVFDMLKDENNRTKWTPGQFALRSASPNKVVRLESSEGVRVTAYFQVKPKNKTVVALDIAKLPAFGSVAPMKETWRLALEKLAEAL